jgi:ABC-type antimicrobial peptide transport system permease subunit
MIIDTQAIQTLLVTLGITVGVAVVLALSFLGAVAAWQRYDRKEHISALERYLAEVARQHRGQHRSAHTS